MTIISGFSKLERSQKINYLLEHSNLNLDDCICFREFDAPGKEAQQVLEEMTENYICNFPVPMGVVTNMILNGENISVPFVTEESSVVAAASKAAKFWASRGGFKAVVLSTTKKGQVHFTWKGMPETILTLFPSIREKLMLSVAKMTESMRNRGGGITEIQLIDKTSELTDYYQLDVSFETAEAMGANFINSCLETFATVLRDTPELNSADHKVETILSVLSNYTPDCKVNCRVECSVEEMAGWYGNLSGNAFAQKFRQAVDIANLDVSRAVTHNKGIFNGIDAVIVATGNDWRAVSASANAYASRNGRYSALTSINLSEGVFRYELELPLAVGTVGGVTHIHPVVKKSMAIMNNPDVRKLMMIAAASGLANNFAAIASLITTGIQNGHMRLHLTNILSQMNANQAEREQAISYFQHNLVSFATVGDYIRKLRKEP